MTEKIDSEIVLELQNKSNSSWHATAEMYDWLVDRFGEDYVRNRLQDQIKHANVVFDRGRRLLHIENSEWIMVVLYWGLRVIGLYNRGYRNFFDIQTIENNVPIKNLPNEFNGYRILHLSDLHLDIDENLKHVIAEKVAAVDYDLALITGDFRASTGGSYQMAIDETIEFMQSMPRPVYTILGNHDFIEFVKPLEEHGGLSFLINESVPIQKDGAEIWLSGIDDPNMYQLDNLKLAYENVPADAVKILMSHSPETWKEAEALGVDFMMAGHTHGGQICLPGRIPIILHAKCPRRFVNGSWEYGEMQAYTSPGTGGCGVPVRFNCPPEITIHTLRKG